MLKMQLKIVIGVESMYCTKCGKQNADESNFCGYCGQTFYVAENISQTALKQEEQLTDQQRIFDSMAKCPNCGSTSLIGNKKGFGIGKAVVGACLVGPIGLVAGNFRAKKVVVTCMKCRKQFKI